MNIFEKTTFIKQQALKLGFDACGIAKADFLKEDADYLEHWLRLGKQGEMSYLDNYFDKRLDPRLLVPNACSVVVVLLNYYPEYKQPKSLPQIAKYAYGNDYHYIIKSKLYELKALIDQEVEMTQGVAFCDSAPVLERRWAQKAGLGWIGKNTSFIHPRLGSFVFIGELIFDLELAYDHPEKNRCGFCRLCLDVCPTRALESEYNMDASRCISYLTIEKKGNIEEECGNTLSGNLFGCDICQDICPWNKKYAQGNRHVELTPIKEMLKMDVETWENISKSDFNRLCKHSALKRAGYDKIQNTLRLLKKKN